MNTDEAHASERANDAAGPIESYLLTDAEARVLLGLSRATLVRLRKSGRIPYVLITDGRNFRYRRSDLLKFADGQLRIVRQRGRGRGSE